MFEVDELISLSMCSQKAYRRIKFTRPSNQGIKLDFEVGSSPMIRIDYEKEAKNACRRIYIKQVTELRSSRQVVSVNDFKVPMTKNESGEFELYWNDIKLGIKQVALLVSGMFNCKFEAFTIFFKTDPSTQFWAIDWMNSYQESVKDVYFTNRKKVEPLENDLTYMCANLKITDLLFIEIRFFDNLQRPNIRIAPQTANIMEITPAFWMTLDHVLAFECAFSCIFLSNLTNLDMNVLLKRAENGWNPRLRHCSIRMVEHLNYDVVLEGIDVIIVPDDIVRQYTDSDNIYEIRGGYDIKRKTDGLTITLVNYGPQSSRFDLVVVVTMWTTKKVKTRFVRAELQNRNAEKMDERTAYMHLCRFVLENTEVVERKEIDSQNDLNINLITTKESDDLIKAMSFEAFREVYRMINQRESNCAIERLIRQRLNNKLHLSQVRKGAYTHVWTAIPDDEENPSYTDVTVVIGYKKVKIVLEDPKRTSKTNVNSGKIQLAYIKNDDGCKLVHQKDNHRDETLIPNIGYEDLAANSFIEIIKLALSYPDVQQPFTYRKLTIDYARTDRGKSDNWIFGCIFPRKVNYLLRQLGHEQIAVRNLHLVLHHNLHEDDQTLSLKFMRPATLRHLTLRLWDPTCGRIRENALPAFLKQWLDLPQFENLKMLDINQPGISACQKDRETCVYSYEIYDLTNKPAENFLTMPKQRTLNEIMTFLKKRIEDNATPERAWKDLCQQMSNETFLPGFEPTENCYGSINLLRKGELDIKIHGISYEAVLAVWECLKTNVAKDTIRKYVEPRIYKDISLSKLRGWAYSRIYILDELKRQMQLTITIGRRKIVFDLEWVNHPKKNVKISYNYDEKGCRIRCHETNCPGKRQAEELVVGLRFQDLAANEFLQIMDTKGNDFATLNYLKFDVEDNEIEGFYPDAYFVQKIRKSMWSLPDKKVVAQTFDVQVLSKLEVTMNHFFDLSFFDPESLKKIVIRTWPIGNMNSTETMGKLLKFWSNLRQWKQAETLFLENLPIEKFTLDLSHFKTVSIGDYNRDRLIHIIKMFREKPPNQECSIIFKNSVMTWILPSNEEIQLIFHKKQIFVQVERDRKPLEEADSLLGLSLINCLGIQYPI